MCWKSTVALVLLLALPSACQNALVPQLDVEAEEEAPVVISKWTDKTELFVEFPPLVVGRESPFAAHFTDLTTFQAVASGAVVTTLKGLDGHTISSRTPTPIVPGIYRPVITPDKSGIYDLSFHRFNPEDGSHVDTVEAGEVHVVAKEADLPESAVDEGDEGITFLKEQQWQIDFATEAVEKRQLSASLKLHAKVEARAEGRVEIVAPIGGRILPTSAGVPAPGMQVEAGETLAMILPLHAASRSRDDLKYALRSVQAELKASQKNLDRIKKLYKDQIVPKRRLEEAEKNIAIIKARFSAVNSRVSLLDVNQKTVSSKKSNLSVERFPLRSPISGTITKINMTSGAQVAAGEALFTIIDFDSLWIEGRLFEIDMPKIKTVTHAHFSASGLATPINLNAADSPLITIGQVIDPVHRSVPLIMQVDNRERTLRIGMHGHLSVPTGEMVNDVAIPLESVVDDRGIAVAFVHVGGESFERRELSLGIEDGGYVQVKSGITAGERIVTKMAYRVYLASLSTQLPQHGHAH